MSAISMALLGFGTMLTTHAAHHHLAVVAFAAFAVLVLALAFELTFGALT